MRRLVALALVAVLTLGGGLGYRASVAGANDCAGFADVQTDNIACQAITELTSRNIINGYATAPPTFGPDDPVQRAQIAAFLMRALAWQGEATTPRSFTDFGTLVESLRTASLILANKCDDSGLCVARGYDAGKCAALGLAAPCFGPNDSVTYAQVISFIARAFQFSIYQWEPYPLGALPYAGVPSVHQTDVKSYHQYAGPIPSAPDTEQGWSSPAPRAWVARSLAQALGLVTPVFPSPSPAASPSSNCSPSYPDFCIPPPPPDLDCKDIPQKNFTVLQPDPHRFDENKNGIGCET